jgi:hypothetical protein
MEVAEELKPTAKYGQVRFGSSATLCALGA